MAHFAQIDDTNIVTQVIVVNNEVINNAEGLDGEAIGIAFCQSLFGVDTVWKQTSYNTQGGINSREGGPGLRKNYASVGAIYDPVRDAFYEPQPFPSWTLNEDTCKWEPPTPYPTDGFGYWWNEPSQSWVLPTE